MQENDKAFETEVLIVGAGPSGLMMACQLALHGIRFRIIDKKEGPTINSGALILQARSLEIFNQIGLAQKIVSEGINANNICFLFKGKHLFKLPIKNIGSGLTPFPNLLMVKQSETEQILTTFINEHGFSLERRCELLSFREDKSSVTSQIKCPDGNIIKIKSQYLIAADGGQSLIRQQLNIPFIGKSHQKSLFITDCKINSDLLSDNIYIAFSDKTISGFFPLPDGKWRVDGTISEELKKNERITFEDVEKHFSERIYMDTQLQSPEWFSIFHSHQHCAASFQTDRCFLIGDAAHIHSPVGAQGMNTGLQDAYNLAWKLAFTLKEKAKASLLETYSNERLPIAQSIIRTTDNIFNLVTSDHSIIKSFRIYLGPLIIKKLFPIIAKKNSARQYLFKSISEIAIHYRNSILSYQSSIMFSPSYSLRPGDRLPFIPFYDNGTEVNIQEKIKGTHYHLFVFSKSMPSAEVINWVENQAFPLTFEIILHTSINRNLFRRLGIFKKGFLLIRPDMYIAFRAYNHNIKKLEKYLNLFLNI